ncbi:MAG: TetR/AcrR family transcriptional regulator [Acidaminobacteraceae bacterium]
MLYKNFEYLHKINLSSDSRKRIIDASIYLFAKKSYKHTSTKSIASLANVSEALIFKKFVSKQNLLHEVIKEILSNYLPNLLNSFFDELIASNISPHNLGDIKALLLGKASKINNNLGYIKIVLFEMNELEDNIALEVQTIINDVFKKASFFVQNLKDNNILKKEFDNRLLLRSFIGMVNFMIFDLNFISDEEEFEERFKYEFEQILNLFLKGASNE